MKIALGTVQFGTNYGVANTSGQIRFEDARGILSEAAAQGADMIDTAIAYGESEAILGRIGIGSWKIVTKLPAAPSLDRDLSFWVERQLRGALERLRVSRLYGVLLHQPGQLLEVGGERLLAALQHAKRIGLTEKIGVSIYSPDQLAALLAVGPVDLVQAPFNILDRRLVDSGWAAALKARDIEIHVRSVFLQGLLLLRSEFRPEKFHLWDDVWKVWDGWLDDASVGPIEACMRFALTEKHIDRVVVGVDSLAQAREIFSVQVSALRSLPIWPALSDLRVINPAQWSEL